MQVFCQFGKQFTFKKGCIGQEEVSFRKNGMGRGSPWGVLPLGFVGKRGAGSIGSRGSKGLVRRISSSGAPRSINDGDAQRADV
ncbi:Uncharacterised protein [Bacteroides xylanisolvens]|nr:Uncharacterised protein [Bacteroides xylanisolvens]